MVFMTGLGPAGGQPCRLVALQVETLKVVGSAGGLWRKKDDSD